MLIRRNFILDLNLPCSQSSTGKPPWNQKSAPADPSRAFHPATSYLLIGYFVVCVCFVRSVPKTGNEERASHLFVSTVGATNVEVSKNI